MKPWLLPMLACPRSGGPLRLEGAESDGAEIVRGTLCSAEGNRYPIVNGIPRLLPDRTSDDERSTVGAFARQWKQFECRRGHMASRELFCQFFPHLERESLRDAVVLDAGCGNGRWTDLLSREPGTRVVGLDYADSLLDLAGSLARRENVALVQGSILAPPFATRTFDRIVSMGVIHHLDDPPAGLRALRPMLREGGRLSVWLYSQEGNGLYLRLTWGLRRLGPHLPPPLLMALSYLLAVPCWLHARTANRWWGTRRDGRPRLPLAGYFELLRKLSLTDVANIVHDQLAPKLARYYRRDEVERLFAAAGYELQELSAPRGNSWSVWAAPADERIRTPRAA